MTIELRSNTGDLIASFTAAAAVQIMEAASDCGHWRSYESKDMKHPIEAFNIDVPFEFGKDNIHGRMAFYIWTDYILIPVGNNYVIF